MNDQQLDLFTLPTPSMPVLDVSRCEARTISYQTAANMVEKYHYAHRVPSIVIAIGMYVDDVLAGCITYGVPPNRNMLACCGEQFIPRALELNRLFIHDWAGRNSESWLIGQSFKLLRNERPSYVLLISYADLQHKHMGTVYQATNWIYSGVGDPGGGGMVDIDGKQHHKKHLYNLFGTADLKHIRALGHKVERTNRAKKNRYIYFLGSKKQRKELRAALKWPVLPYPKNGATR